MNRNQFIAFVIFGSIVTGIIVRYNLQHRSIPVEAPVVAVAPKSISCEFDIEHIDVRSVERDKDGRTLIEYNHGAEVIQTYLQTTDAQHENFVQRFKKKLGVM